MKNYVLELLEQRGLSHIFNEADYKYYRVKLTKGKGRNEINIYFAALNIMDMFIINS